MAARLEIAFDVQGWSVILDLTTGQVHRFTSPTGRFTRGDNPSQSLFDVLGGSQYYGSLSGASGAGWVPARPGRFVLPGLRHSVAKPSVPKGGELLGGLRAVDLGLAKAWGEYHGLVVFVDGDSVAIVPDWGVSDFLRRWAAGEEPLEPTRKVRLTSWTTRWRAGWDDRGDALEEVTIDVTVSGRLPRDYGLSERRVLELLFWERLYDPAAHTQQESHDSYWVEGLGLARAVDGHLYHQGGGILRRPVAEGALDTREGVEKIAPWTKVVSDDLAYVSDRYADGRPRGTVVTPRQWPPREGFSLPSVTPQQYAAVLMGVVPPEVAAMAISEVGDLPAGRSCRGGRRRTEEVVASAVSAEPEPMPNWERELLEVSES